MNKLIKMTAGIEFPELETIEQDDHGMSLGEKIFCWGFSMFAVLYFGVHFVIYLVRLSHGQIPGLS